MGTNYWTDGDATKPAEMQKAARRTLAFSRLSTHAAFGTDELLVLSQFGTPRRGRISREVTQSP